MFQVELGSEYIADIAGTSEGTQIKFHKDGFWYKLDSFGGEGLAEELSSQVLSFSTLKKQEYVFYETGLVNGQSGCRSRDFLKAGEEFITLYRFYQLLTGDKINNRVNALATPEERADFVLDFFVRETDLDLTKYFSKIFTLDKIILNEDRHFNNLGVIRSANGRYKEAPIFDNGKSLLTGNLSVNWNFTLDENVKRTVAKPFSGSFQKNMELFGTGFELDTSGCISCIRQYPDSVQKSVLLYQLGKL